MRLVGLSRRLGPLAPFGLCLACLPWAGLLLAMEPVAAGPLPAGSLLPLQAEAFRARYGQEALFRLRLGVDAASAPTPGASGADVAAVAPPCPVPSPAQAPSWAESAEQRQFNQALEQHRYYAAGQVLGLWQRRHGACP